LVNIPFYADDGTLLGEDPKEVQDLPDLVTTAFVRVGLQMNADKTEGMGERQHNPCCHMPISGN
jgi:hypothetical protein